MSSPCRGECSLTMTMMVVAAVVLLLTVLVPLLPMPLLPLTASRDFSGYPRSFLVLHSASLPPR